VTTSSHTADKRLLVCISRLVYTTANGIAEFTQHQRDVFCVFSGTMVSKFRDFLNTSPQFEDMWDNGWNRPAVFGSRRPVAASQPAAPSGEGADDEMVDDENDFEGLDGSEMVVDAQAQNPVNGNGNGTVNPNGLTNNALQQAIPIPPPLPGFPIGQHPVFFPPYIRFLSSSSFLRQDPRLLRPMFYQTSINNMTEGGVPQPTTSQASAAPLGHGAPANRESPSGASTATIHRPQENGDQSDSMN
jgi:F-box and leucine-rich repeat protein GRR1